MDALLLIPIALPVLCGVLLLVSSFREGPSTRGARGTGRNEGSKISMKEEESEVGGFPSRTGGGGLAARKGQALSEGESSLSEEESPAAGETAATGNDTEKGKAPEAKSPAPENSSAAGSREKGRAGLCAYVSIALGLSAVLALTAAWTGDREIKLFTLLDTIPVYFRIDAVGRLFVTVVSVIWILSMIFAFVYMRHEGKEKRYFGFYLILYGILVAFDFSGNLVTMYLFYELTTLVSMPLVLHNGKRESVMAALKYLFYSMCGAYGGLFGIFFLYRYSDSLTFTAGGTLNPAAVQGHEGILLIAVFAAILGFGAKAGMVPLHAWLPTAHPVAPSPASAVLSGIIVKSGVLAVVRVVYYIVGADFLRGTWVQQAWMGLALLTVFMGSMLAYREQVFKKRLAYSTVSQVSYIMFGLSLLTRDAFTGAMLHVAVHAVVKCGLFLTAGVFVYYFNYTKAEELVGIGKRMPKMLWCYLLLSLTLVGIPPTGGFVSKWYLAQGALQSGTGIFAWLGPVVLLVSALLTAGYLLPVAMKGFFPGGTASAADEELSPVRKSDCRKEPSPAMLLPLVILAALAVLAGIFPGALIQYVSEIASSVL